MIDLFKVKKHYIMALAIMFAVVSLSSTTYSLFIKTDTTDEFTYNTGILDLQFIEGEQIYISNALPKIDSEGLKSEPYTLTIKNVGTLPYQFDIKMLSSTEENAVNIEYVKYQVNNSDPKTLYETSNVIASNILLYPEEEVTFKVKVWLDINTPNNQLGKIFMAKLVTSGRSIYRTLDTSGANAPKLLNEMIPVYYDENLGVWKKADQSNLIDSYEWYNYDNNKWANIVSINNSEKQIYDIAGNNNIKIKELRTNNGNYITDESSLEINLSNYQQNNITSIFRIKFNDLSDNNTYILSNDKVSYYYDNDNKVFKFKIGNDIVMSDTYRIEEGSWHILGFSYDNKQVTFYIDGFKLSTRNITGSIASNNNFKIGIDSFSKELSNIEVGDIYIYKSILSDKEINNNYKNNINIIYNDLLLGYNDFTPKTLIEYYQSQDLGTIIKNEDISSFYVWIPRFKYKVWNITGVETIDSYDAYNKGIDIIFEKDTESTGTIKCQDNTCYNDSLMITKVTANDNGKYYTHPAFTNNEQELTGLWISKYEISKNNNQLEAKPGNNIWRNDSISTYYQTIKNSEVNKNYNIIKNTEWGAVSYLTHSMYGLCKNNKCEDIGTNNTYISGTESKDSTTNNMYGIFDLSGGASEFVMATLNNSEDIKNINVNDYNLYQENNFILGDATKELSLKNSIWYNNYNSFINDTNNWFIRGGIANTINTGIYYYNATTNTPSEYITTRLVIK